MDFKLSKEHEMARKLFYDFAHNELEPLAAEIDEEERFPWESIPKFARYGMMGVPIPKKYGGAGGDNPDVLPDDRRVRKVLRRFQHHRCCSYFSVHGPHHGFRH